MLYVTIESVGIDITFDCASFALVESLPGYQNNATTVEYLISRIYFTEGETERDSNLTRPRENPQAVVFSLLCGIKSDLIYVHRRVQGQFENFSHSEYSLVSTTTVNPVQQTGSRCGLIQYR